MAIAPRITSGPIPDSDSPPAKLVLKDPSGGLWTIPLERAKTGKFGDNIASTELRRKKWVADTNDLHYILDETISNTPADRYYDGSEIDFLA